MKKEKLILITNENELGAGTRGSSLGPNAIRTEAYNNKSELFFNIRNTYKLYSENKELFRINNDSNPNLKNIDAFYQHFEKSTNLLKDILLEDKNPIILSGDHSNGAITISAIKSAFPNKRLGVIWIDAHSDIHTPYTSPSGNIHGMPLAITLGIDNKKFEKTNNLNDKEIKFWEKLKNINNINPKINFDDIVYIGVRSAEDAEEKLISENNILDIQVKTLREIGGKEVAKQSLEYLKNCDFIYISFDVDALDPEKVSYGTGTPVPNGLLPNEVIEMFDEFILDDRFLVLEVLEVNPCLDNKKNKMASEALNILENIYKSIK